MRELLGLLVLRGPLADHVGLRTPRLETTPTAQSLPGCVSRYGIAPYSSVFWSLSGTPSWRKPLLEKSPVGKWSCQAKTTMLAAISSTVRIGNRAVGMLSLSGIKAVEA